MTIIGPINLVFPRDCTIRWLFYWMNGNIFPLPLLPPLGIEESSLAWQGIPRTFAMKTNKLRQISLARKAHHEIFTSRSHSECIFSVWHPRGTLPPRGQNTIWLIDFMICKQFMSEKKILLSHFILLLNVVRDTMAWRRKNKKRKISRLVSLNILFRAFYSRFDISCRTTSNSDVPRVL